MIFITGPARSGKSRFAEQLACSSGKPVMYCATARRNPEDPEWCERLALHQARRPAAWGLLEVAGSAEPNLLGVLRDASREQVLLVDSLGAWLADRMAVKAEEGKEVAACASALEKEAGELAAALCASPAHVIIVGEEVGWGIVPMHPSARVFRDILGSLHQRLACAAERAYLVVSGYAVDLRVFGVPI